jgi:UDP-N-acetylglucosamine 2-epimerase (non-hydrolysing)
VHVEAGLRSFDRDMPEEINRLLTDLLSDLLFVTEQSGVDNLKNEGIAEEKIHFVGNVMIDTLITHLKRIKKSSVKTKLNIEGAYGLVTLHRPSNVDKRETLEPLMGCLDKISQDIPLYFAIHPRTLHSANKFNLLDCFNFKHYHEDLSHIGFVPPLSSLSKIYLMPPQGYLNFLSLITTATLVITDSGGIQEETTFLAIPCITLRENTERPVTIDLGSNYMVGTDPENILKTVRLILDGKGKKAKSPPLWDGNSGKRILKQIIKEVHSKSGSDV